MQSDVLIDLVYFKPVCQGLSNSIINNDYVMSQKRYHVSLNTLCIDIRVYTLTGAVFRHAYQNLTVITWANKPSCKNIHVRSLIYAVSDVTAQSWIYG